jgi:PAS domain S-box-containing protein
LSDTLQTLTEEYVAVLRKYLAEPQEAGLMQAYDLGRRMLTLEVGLAELGVAHAEVLAGGLSGAGTPEERTRLTQRAAEFLGEAMAPFKMILCGYREANTLLQRLNETLEQRVKERTEALRDSEERYRDLFENAGDLIQGATPDGRLLFVNRAWRTYLGYAEDETAHLSLWDIVHRDHRESFLAVCHRALAGESLERVECVFVARDGRQIVVEGTVNCHYVEGRAVAMRGIFRDITERKRMERELAEASRRKDEFLALLAHELRNPLAPIRNALQIVRLANHDTAAVLQASEMMERQVQHLVRLIDDLMDVSRITRGKIVLRKGVLDLAAVVQSALEISRPLIEEARHELTVVLPPEPLYVEADAVRLAQVVANLLNNATKYTESGGRIWLTAERNGTQAIVRVRDTGIGIPAELLPDVFDLFVQSSSAVDRSQGGLGIGLTLVKSLVEMHGGSVEARSAGPRRGSEFIVRLPLAPENRLSQEQPPQENQAAESVPALRILVVDDNPEAANSLGLMMKLVGHEVRTAYNGLAALELARTFQPQVLLQDLQMPGMSGYEVAQRLRAEPAMRNLLLIAVTGHGSEQDRRRCFEAGFDHHLVKPVDLHALQQLLASLAAPAGEQRG